MRFSFRPLAATLICWFCITHAYSVITETGNPPIQIVFFYSPTCNDCSKLKSQIETLKKKYPQIILNEYNLSVVENIGLLNKYYNTLRVPYEKWGGTLALFIGSEWYVDYESAKNGLENTIKKYIPVGASLPEIEHKQNLREMFQSFGIFTIISAGLIDGLNPCAFATIIFLIAYLSMIKKRSRKEIFFTGMLFTAGIFFSYLLIGFGIMEFINRFEHITFFSKAVYVIIGLFTLMLAYYSFKDYLAIKKIRKGETDKIRLSLPVKFKWKIHDTIERFAGYRYFVILAFFCGCIISVLEFFCTGQVYLPTIVYILSIPELKLKAFSYLVLYAVMFIIPLLIVFMLVYFGLTSEKIDEFNQNHATTVKLATSLLFLFLAVSMFIMIL